MELLNESQKLAATFQGKHALVLAGAGTGKTKTIIARAAYLISRGVDPQRIQILTFTKRAASEIVNRVKSSLESGDAKGLSGSTFHSWCNHLMSKYSKLFGTEKFTIIDTDDQVSIMKLICGKNKYEYERVRLKPIDFIDLYSFARNTNRNLTNTLRIKLFENEEYEKIKEQLEIIKSDVGIILRAYEAKKKARHYLDYDDMLQLVATRIKNDAKTNEIICSLYDHILVDEMQDTNPLQWELLEPFQNKSHLFCVGDDAQSIYAFRGADFRNIHDFTKRVPESTIIRLEDNYRSTQEILDISNWLLTRSPLEYNKHLKAVRGTGHKPIILNTEDSWDEARYIADAIIENFTNRGKSYKDHLILTRALFMSRTIQAIFIQRKIPYVTYGGRGFMESAHIKDVFSALRVVNNYTDEIAWIRFLTLWYGIGEVTASKLISQMNLLHSIEECINLFNSSIFEEATSIKSTLESIYLNRDDVRGAVTAGYRHLAPILSDKYKEDWVQKRQADFPILEMLASNYSNISEFIAECLLDNTQINNSPNLKKSQLDKATPKDHVIISTVHSAKGLEADICFVLHVSPSYYPSIRSFGNLDEIEEDRRVLYVALTRAKNELFITRSLSSLNAQLVRGTGSRILESYFLHELPDDLVIQSVIPKDNVENNEDHTSSNTDLEFGMDFS